MKVDDIISCHDIVHAVVDGENIELNTDLATISITAGLASLSGDTMALRPIVNGRPIKMVDDADIDGQLNWVYNKIRAWEKEPGHGPVANEPWNTFVMMSGAVVDTKYLLGEGYLYQHTGTEHPRLLNRTFINSDLNYIGFGVGIRARGHINEREMHDIIWIHLLKDFWPPKFPSDNTFAAADTGWEWLNDKFSSQR